MQCAKGCRLGYTREPAGRLRAVNKVSVDSRGALYTDLAPAGPPASRIHSSPFQRPRWPHPAMKFQGSDNYVATQDLMLAVNAAITLKRPLLVKGEPGTGKTMLAEEVAQ